jgi:glutamate synthase (ferredoxin)
LGAEEFGFATAALVAEGCIMMRVCHLDTCPVGIATQNPELRKKFTGKPEYVVNFMHFIAEEVREIMAELGFKTINEMVGHSELLEMNEAIAHWKTKGLDFSAIFYRPEESNNGPVYCVQKQDHGLEKALDNEVLIERCMPALNEKKPVKFEVPIRNINRTVGTLLGAEISRKYGAKGLPDDTIQITFKGSAGQSFGAFVPKGMTLRLEGDANDYLGKGLCGGKIMVYPQKEVTFKPEENIIVGNVLLYGATSGEVYIRGKAGERFGVRNSGVQAVVEGVGDHGCEYMTGGHVVVIGETGRNFAAGMSGGVAYVWDKTNDFPVRCNREMVDLEALDEEDVKLVHEMIRKHKDFTGSTVAEGLIKNWDKMSKQFVKVMPVDYKKALIAQKEEAAKPAAVA